MSQNNDNTINIPLITDTRPVDLIKHQKDRLAPETMRPDSIPQQEGDVGSQQETTIPLDPRLNLTRGAPAFDIPLPLPVFSDNQDIRSIVLDTLKNISINGISPQISGSSIAFNIPESPYSASQMWGLMNNASELGDVSSVIQAYGGYLSQLSPADQPYGVKQTTQDAPVIGVGTVVDNTQLAATQQFNIALGGVGTNETQYVTPKGSTDTYSDVFPPYLGVSNSGQSAESSPSNTGGLGVGVSVSGGTVDFPPDTSATPSTAGYLAPTPYSAAISPPTTTDTTTSPQIVASNDNSGSAIAVSSISVGGTSGLSDESSGGSDLPSSRYDEPTTGTSSSSVQNDLLVKSPPELLTADQTTSIANQLLAVPFKRGDDGDPQMVYFVTAGYEPIEDDPKPNQNINSAYGGSPFKPSDYWIPVGGSGGAGGTFLASQVVDENGMVTAINVTAGSYHILNTNTDVDATSGDGKYVYAIIEHSNAGIFKEFKIEISQTSKDPTNMDPTDKFVQFSNILLAEGMVVDEKPKMIQRRVGNLSLVHQVISGHICLWAYSSGGTSL